MTDAGVARRGRHRDCPHREASLASLAGAVLATVGLSTSGAWAHTTPTSDTETTPAAAAEAATPPDTMPEKFLALPLEELLTIRVTTASLRSQEIQEVPATTYVVTEEDFHAYGYRDLKDVLRNLPGIDYVFPNSHLFGGQRGFSSFWEMTKLLINGRETNNLSSDAAYIVNQFPLSGVKQVEVVQGPASVLYGPEAFTGVINIITKDAENSPEETALSGFVGGGDKSSLDVNGAVYTVAKRDPVSVAVGAYVDGSRGPNDTSFLRTADYSETNRDIRGFLLDHGNPYRDDDRNLRFNADLTYSPSSRLQIKAGALYWWSKDGMGIENPAMSYTNDEFLAEQMHCSASGEYRFATVPVKATLSYHFMLENLYARFQSYADLGDNPPMLAAFTFEKDFTPMYRTSRASSASGSRSPPDSGTITTASTAAS